MKTQILRLATAALLSACFDLAAFAQDGFNFRHYPGGNEADGAIDIGISRDGRSLPLASVDHAVTASIQVLPSATPGVDFTPISGTLVSAEGVSHQFIRVVLLLRELAWLAKASLSCVAIFRAS